MDDNKLKKLKEIKYGITDCCAICKHSQFPNNFFGVCKIHKYKHKKHTGLDRQLSIHVSGYCEEGFALKEDEELSKFFDPIKDSTP